jgi:hypothetical protein
VEISSVYAIFVGKPEGKRALGKPSRRWYDNIKLDLRDRDYEVVDCIIWITIGTVAL